MVDVAIVGLWDEGRSLAVVLRRSLVCGGEGRSLVEG